MTLVAINPADGTEVGRYDQPSADDVAAAIDRADAAFGSWRQRPIAERADRLRSLAATLRANSADLAREATLEMGKPIVEAEAEVEKCAWNCEFYADNASALPADEPQPIERDARATCSSSPLGTVLAIMPWNFPFWQLFRFAAPALMAGNIGDAQARLERAAVRAGDRGRVPRRPVSRTACSRRCWSAPRRVG